MFSPNQLYDYLRYYCYINKKNATVRNFVTNGSKNLLNLTPTQNIYTNVDLLKNKPDSLRETTGCIDMFDQEPVDINAYFNETYTPFKKERPHAIQLKFNNDDFVFARSMAIYTPIICHSEINSKDINEFTKNFYTPVHFWSNAILSRYWFSHYELLSKNYLESSSKRFGVYIRDTSGTRNYRKDLISFLKKDNIKSHIFCPGLEKMDSIPSHASASIEWPDHTKFDIHIVPETLFDVSKIHLTEKIFKPIVMYQPFIIFSGKHSLQYLKKYGFKTFDSCWDESYDEEENTSKRFTKITKVITDIINLDAKEYAKLIAKTTKITHYNKNHFYSDKFKKILLSELDTNLSNALKIQEDNFYTIPGGTLFYYHDLYYQLSGKKAGKLEMQLEPLLHNALKYAYTKSNKVGDAILKKYNHLI